MKDFLDQVKWRWEDRGVIYNWLGRRYDLDDKRWSYKGPNKLIQGGCADIVKIAMVELYAYLCAYKSRMVLQVHDEILFEIAHDELRILPELVRIMETGIRMNLLCILKESFDAGASEDTVGRAGYSCPN